MANKPIYSFDYFDEYLSKKNFISSSDIKNFLLSPAYYHYKKYQEEEKEDSKHLLLGSAIHAKILEPAEFDKRYCVGIKYDMRTAVGKEKHKEFQEQNEGKEIIFEEDFKMIEAISENAKKNKTFCKLIENSHKELSIYTEDEETGLKIKLRPDILCREYNSMIDLKSCVDSSPKSFSRDVKNYRYDISSAWYSDFGLKKNYLFMALSKEQPYSCCLYSLSESLISNARQQYRMALDLLKFCYDNNYWPQYVEFDLMKELYHLDSLDQFFEQKEIRNEILIIE